MPLRLTITTVVLTSFYFNGFFEQQLAIPLIVKAVMTPQNGIWQVDFYRTPTNHLWELVVCNEATEAVAIQSCDQSEATVDWLVDQLTEIAEGDWPQTIRVFRPESLQLLQLAGQRLGIAVEGTRRTPFLKQILRDRAGEQQIKVESPPPQPLPEELWGQQWQFARLPAEEIEYRMPERLIPFFDMPTELTPFQFGLGSTTTVPGIIIYGGRQSWKLAEWMRQAQPVSINYIATVAGESGGLVLEAGLRDRWVIITFEDSEVAQAGEKYEQRKHNCKGLHFLLIQPDDSGMTDTGFWLLQQTD